MRRDEIVTQDVGVEVSKDLFSISTDIKEQDEYKTNIQLFKYISQAKKINKKYIKTIIILSSQLR